MVKKKESLSFEERLEKALVPDWEQPYKVPKNWLWTTISVGFNVTSSKRVHQSDWLTSGIPFYRTRELVKLSEYGFVDNELYISEEMYKNFKEEYGVPQIGDLLISGVGTIGVPYVIKNSEKLYFKDGNVIWLKNKGLFDASYIFYLYKSFFLINQITEMSAGSTVDTYTIINANKTKIALPPPVEQQRIVDRIESLFSKLDEAKEKAQTALGIFENRKAAILHKAFTGELTKKWREENGVEFDSWEEGILGSFLLKMTTKKPTGDIFRYIDIDSIDNKNQKVYEPKVLQVSKAPSRASREIMENDTLFSMVRPYLKNIAFIYRELSDCIASTGFYVCRPKRLLHPRYLYNFLCSKEAIDYLMQFMKGDNSPSIRGSNIEEMPFKLPSLPEQTEIVRILDSIFEKEAQAKELASVIKKIDLMKKAILARALRGELGTNNPEEESALELLKEILNEEFESSKEKKTVSKRISVPKEVENIFKTNLEREIYKTILKNSVATMDDFFVITKKFPEIMEALKFLKVQGLIDEKEGSYRLK